MSKKRNGSKTKRYPTDLNKIKWLIIKPLLPKTLPNGHPRAISLKKSLMRFSTLLIVAVLGVYCLMNFQHGKQFRAIIVTG